MSFPSTLLDIFRFLISWLALNDPFSLSSRWEWFFPFLLLNLYSSRLSFNPSFLPCFIVHGCCSKCSKRTCLEAEETKITTCDLEQKKSVLSSYLFYSRMSWQPSSLDTVVLTGDSLSHAKQNKKEGVLNTERIYCCCSRDENTILSPFVHLFAFVDACDFCMIKG